MRHRGVALRCAAPNGRIWRWLVSGRRKSWRTPGALFDAKRGPKPVDETSSEDKLYGEIGRLKMDVDWLKKS
jgi:hypothetical protein